MEKKKETMVVSGECGGGESDDAYVAIRSGPT
jgi:hypothetical protein